MNKPEQATHFTVKAKVLVELTCEITLHASNTFQEAHDAATGIAKDVIYEAAKSAAEASPNLTLVDGVETRVVSLMAGWKWPDR